MPNLRNSALEAAGAELVRKLGGVWHDHGGMCRCPAHDDRTPSLSVRIGDRSLLFKCFAGCTGLDVMRAIRRFNFDVPVDDNVVAPPTTRFDLRRKERIRSIWRDARVAMGSPVATYLESRGITHLSSSLRFHPRTPLGKGRCVSFRPAMIAAVQDDEGVSAIQRTFFDRRSPCLAQDLPKAKLALGRPGSGAVRLYRATCRLGLAEGIETAESAAILLNIPVWATLGNERLARIAIPDFVDELILLPDNDHGGRLAAKQALAAYQRSGRSIRTVWPWRGLNDWNEVLMEELGLSRRPDGRAIAA
jgi:hypothetical protein